MWTAQLTWTLLVFFQGFPEVFYKITFLGYWVPLDSSIFVSHIALACPQKMWGEEVINKKKSVWEDSSICHHHCAHLSHALVVGEERLYFHSCAKNSLPVCLHPLMILLGESWFKRSKAFHIHILLNNVMVHLSSLAKWQICLFNKP